MLILTGADEASSFNDEGSPDARLTDGTKVCVDAQVIRELSLDWYYRLLSFFPDIPGELKSGSVVARFKDLPEMIRRAIWADLSRVRIHIVDARPHYKKINNILRDATGSTNAPEIIRQAAAQGAPAAKRLITQLRAMVADSILGDSTATKAHLLARALANPFYSLGDNPFCGFGRKASSSQFIDVEDFGNSHGVVRTVASWAAKSAAAFQSAIDAVLNADHEELLVYRFGFDKALQRRMARQLLPVHAFDKGDLRQVQVLEETRDSLFRELTVHEHLYGLIAQRGFIEVESSECFCVQAADLAAGIASDLYGSEGLVGVVSRFSYVTYNGSRVSLADAEEEMKRSRVQ